MIAGPAIEMLPAWAGRAGASGRRAGAVQLCAGWGSPPLRDARACCRLDGLSWRVLASTRKCKAVRRRAEATSLPMERTANHVIVPAWWRFGRRVATGEAGKGRGRPGGVWETKEAARRWRVREASQAALGEEGASAAGISFQSCIAAHVISSAAPRPGCGWVHSGHRPAGPQRCHDLGPGGGWGPTHSLHEGRRSNMPGSS